MQGRFAATREDVRALAAPVMRHRLLLSFAAEAEQQQRRRRDRRAAAAPSPSRAEHGDRTLDRDCPPRCARACRDAAPAAARSTRGWRTGIGQHASRSRGAGLEFAQYRAYEPGDELRQIDWKLYARSDRYLRARIRARKPADGLDRDRCQRLDGPGRPRRARTGQQARRSLRTGRLRDRTGPAAGRPLRPGRPVRRAACIWSPRGRRAPARPLHCSNCERMRSAGELPDGRAAAPGLGAGAARRRCWCCSRRWFR